MEGTSRRILVLGYGNPGRQDDGLGPLAADAIADWRLPGVTVEANYLLNIEDAADVAEHDVVVFVDAAVEGPEPFEMKRAMPAHSSAFTSHIVPPETILAISEQVYGRAAKGWILAIRGYEFELIEELTEPARRNLERALAHARHCFETGFVEVGKNEGQTLAKVSSP